MSAVGELWRNRPYPPSPNATYDAAFPAAAGATSTRSPAKTTIANGTAYWSLKIPNVSNASTSSARAGHRSLRRSRIEPGARESVSRAQAMTYSGIKTTIPMSAIMAGTPR
jgi:hypothetical protein